MKIGVIGAGRIGGDAARLFAAAGHDVSPSPGPDPVRLRAKAADLGRRARNGDVRDAVASGDATDLGGDAR
ncbi:NAD(P)-binding domain-containing protein [Actinoallomurus soli]|uniref:NAD(P)-binding domain-containing protein n=1 Tax=Actinoallomurus soli TaxID=2952535 RepID=UPI0020923091|nr:NAD(P)-binding domain-containing protein [Actinoallomurus soli]MCO5974482.1 NAD(P)-binding domain-containing protein [Actinoallomurus soli]